MTDVVDKPAVPAAGRPAERRPEPAKGQWRPLLVRMHFYAGLLVAPFVFLACLSGMIYVFNPQIDRLMEPGLLVVEHPGSATLPINQQVAKAVAAAPGLNVVSVVPNTRPDETTRVNFYRPGGKEMTNYTVFVNPYSGAVQGKKEVSSMGGSMPFSTWMAGFHGDLHLGDFGRWYSEMASLWLVILTLGGIVVWWQRCAVHRKVTSSGFWKRLTIVDRGKRPGVKRTMSWHSTIGIWTAILALLFGLSGLPFARTSGPKWMSVTSKTSSMHRATVTLDTKLPGAPASGGMSGGMSGMSGMSGSHDMSGSMSGMSGATDGKPAGAPATTGGNPAGAPATTGGNPASAPAATGGKPAGAPTGTNGMSGMSGMSGKPAGTSSGMSGMMVNTGLPSNATADFDAMAAAAKTVGVDQKIRITGPSRPGIGWTVAENKQDWPIAINSTLIDPSTNQVVRTLDWNAKASAWDKVNRYIMLFHFGRLFGFVGQVIFGLTMLGVLWITWWGYKMWWQRRPRGTAWRFGKAPARGTWRKAPKVSLVVWTAVTLALFWIFPVLGVSVIGFLVLDAVLGQVQNLRRRKAATAPASA